MRILQILISLVFVGLFNIHSFAMAESATPKSVDSPGLRLLEEIQTVITDLAEAAKPSVVNLFPLSGPGRGKEQSQERAPNATGSGSGVIIDSEGHIVTNNHVIGDATEIEVRFSDKSKLIAQVVGKDLDTDLAVLKVTADHPLPSAKFGDSSAVRVGQWVLAVGNPFGLDRTVTLGVVSGIGRENINLSRYENFIQTDASINPGNSGGPLITARGEAIGINSAIFTQTGGSVGIGFAIPIDLAKTVVAQLAATGHVVRGYLGVTIQPVTADLAKSFGLEETAGALVSAVTEGSPAAKAGVKPGDVITDYNGRKVARSEDLPQAVAVSAIGREVPLTVMRDSRAVTLRATVGTLEDSASAASSSSNKDGKKSALGLALAPHRMGVVVQGVEDDSPAANAGIRPGDVITEIDHRPVKSLDDVRQAMDTRAADKPALFLVRRDAATVYIAVDPARG